MNRFLFQHMNRINYSNNYGTCNWMNACYMHSDNQKWNKNENDLKKKSTLKMFDTMWRKKRCRKHVMSETKEGLILLRSALVFLQNNIQKKVANPIKKLRPSVAPVPMSLHVANSLLITPPFSGVSLKLLHFWYLQSAKRKQNWLSQYCNDLFDQSYSQTY